jgi:hypothetical protein
MRKAVASALVLFVISVVALCPAIACPLIASSPAQSGCCHKPAKTVPDCPYSILEKSKTNPAPLQVKWVSSIAHTEHDAAVFCAIPIVEVPCRLSDVSGLFLRNCVLRI